MDQNRPSLTDLPVRLAGHQTCVLPSVCACVSLCVFVGCLSSSSTTAGHKATDKEGQSTHTHARTQAHTHTHTCCVCLWLQTKQKRSKKYLDQDEEERKIRMDLLGVSGTC